MTRPLLFPVLAFAILAGCSKKEADSQSEPAPAPPVSAEASVAPSASASASGGASSAGATSANAGGGAATGASSAVLAASAAIVVATLPDGGPACGVKPLPDCPMQGWMKRNTSAAMAAGDMPAVAFAFDQMIPFGPPGYTNWASISRDGAAAARMGNADAAKAACRGCHDQYRTKYRTELRARPIP